MQRILKKSLVSAALSVALLGAAVSYAQVPHSGEHSHEAKLERMTKLLDLSESQQNEIKQVFQSNMSQKQADRKRLMELKRELRDFEGDFDAAAVQAKADEIGQITSRMTFQSVKAKQQLRELLSEEQRSKLKQHHAERKGHAKRGHHKKGQHKMDH